MKAVRIVLIACVCLLGVFPLFAQETPAGMSTSSSIVVAPELYERGLAALDAGNFERAALDISLFILLNPTFSQAYLGRAYTAIYTDDFQSAIEDITRAIDLAPIERYRPDYIANLHILRGQLYAELDDSNAAIMDFDMAIDLAPTEANFTTRGAYFASEGDFDAALDDYNAAIALSPSTQNIMSRALLYSDMGDYEAALEDLDDVLVTLPNDPFLALVRASIFDRMEESENAAGEYLRYVRLINTNLIENDLLTPNQPVIVDMTQGTVHVFPFQAQAGQVVTISAQARPGDQLDPLILLLDPQGTPVAANDDFGTANLDAQITRVRLTSSGYYAVILTHAMGGSEGQAAIGYVIRSAGS